MSRSRLILYAVIAAVALAVATFPLWSPFFRTDVVDEAFPGLTSDQRSAIRSMPEDVRSALIDMSRENRTMAEDTAAAMLEPDVPVAEAMPEMPAAPAVLLQGSFIFIDAVHNAEGAATIYEIDGQRVLRFEDFRVTNGPDLHVILSKITPTSIFSGVGEGMIDLGKLKGNVGSQNYEIAASVDLGEYQSVVIYCVPFGVVFSSAALSVPAVP